MKKESIVLIWIFLCFLYLLNDAYFRKLEIGFYTNYWNDLIALPWVFASITLIYRYMLKVKLYYVTGYQIYYTLLSFSVIFEGILPICFPERYYADIYDVVMYTIGSCIWGFIRKKI